MKIRLLYQIFNSTLSCKLKCLRFFNMIPKKIFFGLLALSFLAGCGAPTAMLGPAYTLSSSGSVMQAGFSYGSNEMITMYTGKTPIENVIEMSSYEKNIKKQTLESEDFHILVKNKINKTGAILKKTNQ